MVNRGPLGYNSEELRIGLWIGRTLMVAVALGVLAGCALFPLIGGPQVIGNLVGEWPGGTRLALVGVSAEGQIDYSNQTQIVDENIFDGYLFALPETAAEGIYQIVAFEDSDADNKFSEAESLGNTGDRYLIYSASDKAVDFLGRNFVVRRGWNGYDVAGGLEANPHQADTYRDFDLFLD
jgi:hypothetical protein